MPFAKLRAVQKGQRMQQFKTVPYAHQLAALECSADQVFYALTMEQGTGKTKVILDTTAHLYNRGRVNALLVLAPNGVHRNWATKEIPKHLPDYVPRACSVWHSTSTKAERAAHDAMLIAPANHLRVFTMNIEAMAVERAVVAVRQFLDSHDALVVVDESTRIKNPKSIRTKNVLALSPIAKYRRILTGTPVPNSPLDVFAQYSFLDPDLFHTRSFTVFRARYADMLPTNHPLIQAIIRRTGIHRIPQLIATDAAGRPMYKNLDELRGITQRYTYRVLKRDCLDLPPKVYVRIPIELHPLQQRAYKDLLRRLREGLLEGDKMGRPLTKLNAIMYLQRILLGTLPAPMTASGQHEQLVTPAQNPRLQALLGELDETSEQVIVWCRYTDDIRLVTGALVEEYGAASVVQYYGEVGGAERDSAIARFNKGEARFFVGNPQAGGVGVDGLQVAGQVHYFSNSFKYDERVQSEDRAHRIGQRLNVRYVDYETEGTVDTKILRAFEDKKDVADAITGDAFEEWLR
jgi:SNF2 family DNA or RNA helicase